MAFRVNAWHILPFGRTTKLVLLYISGMEKKLNILCLHKEFWKWDTFHFLFGQCLGLCFALARHVLAFRLFSGFFCGLLHWKHEATSTLRDCQLLFFVFKAGFHQCGYSLLFFDMFIAFSKKKHNKHTDDSLPTAIRAQLSGLWKSWFSELVNLNLCDLEKVMIHSM